MNLAAALVKLEVVEADEIEFMCEMDATRPSRETLE